MEKEAMNFSNVYVFLQFVVDVIFVSLDTTERLRLRNECVSVKLQLSIAVHTSGMNNFLAISNRNGTLKTINTNAGFAPMLILLLKCTCCEIALFYL